MHGILVVIFLFISIGMSRATATRNFNQCFPGWAKADQVTVSCNDIKIAQYCDSGLQSCRTMNKPGVSLEKGSKGVCLNINNCSYDSRSCEALSYIDHEQQGTNNFTVDVCNQTPSTSYSTGNNESQSDTIAAGVTAPVIGLLIIFFILYQKVKHFRKAIRGFFIHPQCNKENPNQEPDIEKGEEENFLSSG